eukprot:GHVR01125558.1.p1 GENE.GHVR01125558.1~~GHVR01125558.1.p1  ORF type:complete len:179 (+),score=7.23 GHVR01125558.1:131-667(+)
MTHRVVSGLIRAEALTRKPSCIPQGRYRGVKALGIAYERAAQAALPIAKPNPWFMFRDKNGLGYCSPDLVLIGSGLALVIECKLSDIPEARTQITQLYAPVLQMALGLPIRGLVVTKHINAASTRVVDSWENALAIMRRDLNVIPTLHWLGRSPIIPQQRSIVPWAMTSSSRAISSTA